ncbi:DUF1697 domain-containing protein [Epilithonimonas arachidiradicis]|uniref:Pyridoxamine 5'-phosphate oxidase n=1 Tax=Epilithonimonas arachidiradicis TaxID=1617282 RepID=A0A420CMQ1_9FLAO|nr:DUF1697 domain-containing protein [Epilithonimonas arachidiradicis]RKE79666.1 uncharacterized protein (DUF1697 family) [Epilithonimonas arachidiradicis]GGG52688.1 pyridoxamine 5'-phosphate oxidase [Epilithonimonas arachidiradicis]
MNNFCAFLRGVNVKGTNMKMADVCKVFTDAGVQNVSSVLASGNILFQSDKDSVELKKILEKAMSDHFNYEAFLFIKNEKEVIEILKNDPFPTIENFHNYVFLGSKKVEETLLEEFEKSSKAEGEKGKIINNIFYWQVPKGQTLDSNFGKVLGKKSLKDKMTSRNVNTFEKIIKKFDV